MLSLFRFTYSMFVCTSMVLTRPHITHGVVYMSTFILAGLRAVDNDRLRFEVSGSRSTWSGGTAEALQCLLTDIRWHMSYNNDCPCGNWKVHRNSSQPFIYYVLSDGCCLQNPFTAFLRASWFLRCVYWHIMHLFVSVSILSLGLFMSGIPKTSFIQIASNKILISYLVIQDFQQIRYSFSVQLPLQLDILEAHNLSMWLKIMSQLMAILTKLQ